MSRPLAEVRREAEEALASDCHPYTECMSEGVPCHERMAVALRALLDATDDGCHRLAAAEARVAELEAALLTGIEWLLDMAERKNHFVTPESCLAQAERLRALAGGEK